MPRAAPAIPAGADADDAAGPQPPRAPRAPRRSSWRPADHPEWSEPERPVGWLTDAPSEQTAPDAPDESEQLTMPLEGDE